VSANRAKLLPFEKKKESSEVHISWTQRDHIEPGDYPAFSQAAKIYRDPMFKRWVCSVSFAVTDDSLTNVVARLSWFLNLGRAESPHAGRRSKFWAAYCLANGGHPPSRADRKLSSRIFEHRQCTVTVADVARDFSGMTTSAETTYSIVTTVKSWNTGGGA
jgi:hypothetical protein